MKYPNYFLLMIGIAMLTSCFHNNESDAAATDKNIEISKQLDSVLVKNRTKIYLSNLDFLENWAEKNDPEAQYYFGFVHRYGWKGVKLDYSESIKWYEKSAAQGNADAALALALAEIYDGRDDFPKDEKKAVNWFKKAADMGNAEAQSALGMKYLLGEGVIQDEKQSEQWFLKAAEQGEEAAVMRVFNSGYGFPDDWLQDVRSAAEGGDARAQLAIGKAYESGRAGTDDKQAVFWVLKAAGQGNAYAQVMLGEFYGSGRGVAQNYIKAHMWFNLAAASLSGSNRESAIKSREILANKMTPTQVGQAQDLARVCQASKYQQCD